MKEVNSRIFIQSLRIQARIIGALLMREILTRYGRSNLGFMWLFIEPMLFTGGVVLIWSTLRVANYPLPIAPFALSGYATILVWRNTIARSISAIEPNRALMHHRNVRVIDIYASRIILELSGVTVSFLFLLSFFGVIGLVSMPDDLIKMIYAWALLAWFSAGMAMIIGSLSEFSEVVDRVWHVISYLMLPISGAFFMVAWLPEGVRELALWVPMVNCTELLRDGLFGSQINTYYSIEYMLKVNLVVSLLGLALARKVSSAAEGGE